MAAEALSNLVTNITKENSQFRKAANQQNDSISRFMKDVFKIFTTQSQSQNSISNSLTDIQQSTTSTSQKADQTNSLLRESISIQNQMLNELKTSSASLRSLFDVINQSLGGFGSGNQSQRSLLGSLFSGPTSLALNGALGIMEGGAGGLTGMLGGNNFFGGGMSDTVGANERGVGNKLSVSDMTKLAEEAGFNKQDAAVMAAIAAAESSGRTSAHNPNTSTGDDSYGLWQINMLGKLGPQRKAEFGISRNEELFDPKINAAAAKKVYDQQGFEAWSVYKNGAYRKYLGTAMQSLEKDDASAPEGTVVSKDYVTGKSYGVNELQQKLAGVRKLPLSPNLKSVLDRAAAEAGVEVNVYSGGQPAKGKGGPRTGSTRHDDGNAADLFLTKGGRKLSDTNPEDRAIMAKFVSAAVAAGATGVGAGHNYMGPENIHIGFGKQATWGGAPWIKQAAAGIYNNKDLSSEGGPAGGISSNSFGIAGNQSQGYTGIESVDSMIGSMFSGLAGTPFAGLAAGLTGAVGTMASGVPGLLGMLGAGLSENIQEPTSATPADYLKDNALAAETSKFAGQQSKPSSPQPQIAAAPQHHDYRPTNRVGSDNWFKTLAGTPIGDSFKKATRIDRVFS